MDSHVCVTFPSPDNSSFIVAYGPARLIVFKDPHNERHVMRVAYTLYEDIKMCDSLVAGHHLLMSRDPDMTLYVPFYQKYYANLTVECSPLMRTLIKSMGNSTWHNIKLKNPLLKIIHDDISIITDEVVESRLVDLIEMFDENNFALRYYIAGKMIEGFPKMSVDSISGVIDSVYRNLYGGNRPEYPSPPIYDNKRMLDAERERMRKLLRAGNRK